MFQKFLKMFKNFQFSENTPYPSINTEGPCNPPSPSNPMSPQPPKPEFFYGKERIRFFEGCGYYLPATNGLSYKGGINEGPVEPRPSPPTLTHKEKTAPGNKNHK